MEDMKILTDVASDQLIASPQITVVVDRQAASTLGVTPSAVDTALYAAFGQQQIAMIYTSTQQPRLIMEVQPKFQIGPTDLSKIYVASSAGTQVPLASFAHYNNRGPTPVSSSTARAPTTAKIYDRTNSTARDVARIRYPNPRGTNSGDATTLWLQSAPSGC
jgi:multidrug efflux pump